MLSLFNRAEHMPSTRPSPSSPASSTGEPSGTSKYSHSHQENKEHSAHPTCPDTLRCLPDTDGRPQHTLPVILRCTILGSKMKRLTIREIYAAMEEKYPYYRTAGSTWKVGLHSYLISDTKKLMIILLAQQSVRHHLSLNRLFERQPRPVTDPGFGSYWTVNLQAPPGTKRPRKRGRPQREVNGDSESVPVKKRGRPRKVPEMETHRQAELPRIATLSVPSADHMSPVLSVSTVRPSCRQSEDEDEDPAARFEHGAPWGAEEDLESEDDGDLPLRPATPAYDRAITVHHTPSPSRSTLRHLQDDSISDAFPENIIDHLKVQMGKLRRQASDSRSEAARMAQQLLESQAETARARSALCATEERLEVEIRKRKEAERVADEEAQMRKMVEDELRTLQ